MKESIPAPNKYPAINMETYKTRASQWRWKEDSSTGKRMRKLPKLNVPSPGTYEVEDSFRKSQYEHDNKEFVFNKSKEKNFVEKYIKLKSYIPSPGAHANFEKAFERASRSPTTRRNRL